MPTVPKLPAALVAVLGVLASLLAVVQPSLPEPWPAIAGGVLALLTLVGVQVTHSSVSLHGRRAWAHRTAQEATAREIRYSRRPDDGRARPLLLVALAVVTLLAASAGPATAHWHPGRGPAPIVVAVPEITSGVACTSRGAQLQVRVLAVTTSRTGTVVTEQSAPSGVRLQGLLLGTWYDVEASTSGGGGLHTSGVTYGRWRPILGDVTGPAWSIPGDLLADCEA